MADSDIMVSINLLEKPTGGHIFIEGEEITGSNTNVDKLRERVGMVFQQFNLFPHLSAKKNVMLAQRKVLKRSAADAERIAFEQLDRVELADRVIFMEGGVIVEEGSPSEVFDNPPSTTARKTSSAT